jgi:hypothetical protein
MVIVGRLAISLVIRPIQRPAKVGMLGAGILKGSHGSVDILAKGGVLKLKLVAVSVEPSDEPSQFPLF